MELFFRDKKVFITGGSRGIGKKICELFLENGAEVYSPSRKELDLSDRGSIREYLTEHSDISPNIFIHCAGLNKLAGIDELCESVLDEVFQVNYFSATELLKAFVPRMKEEKKGKILFISSLYSIVSKERRIAYSSSKNALTGLAKTLAIELAPYNVLVNLVAPGYVMTDMTRKNLSDGEIDEIKRMIPTGRFQTEEDIANAVAFLCSDLNQSITGQLVAVDGGLLCK